MQRRSIEPQLSGVLSVIEGIERELGGITSEDFHDDYLLRHATPPAVEIISKQKGTCWIAFRRERAICWKVLK